MRPCRRLHVEGPGRGYRGPPPLIPPMISGPFVLAPPSATLCVGTKQQVVLALMLVSCTWSPVPYHAKRVVSQRFQYLGRVRDPRGEEGVPALSTCHDGKVCSRCTLGASSAAPNGIEYHEMFHWGECHAPFDAGGTAQRSVPPLSRRLLKKCGFMLWGRSSAFCESASTPPKGAYRSMICHCGSPLTSRNSILAAPFPSCTSSGGVGNVRGCRRLPSCVVEPPRSASAAR